MRASFCQGRTCENVHSRGVYILDRQQLLSQHSKAKQSKAKQSKAKQSKAKQSKAHLQSLGNVANPASQNGDFPHPNQRKSDWRAHFSNSVQHKNTLSNTVLGRLPCTLHLHPAIKQKRFTAPPCLPRLCGNKGAVCIKYRSATWR